MATQEISTDSSAGPRPVACALTLPDLAAQAGRWARLAARAMTRRAETAHGLRLWFRPEPGVEEELRTLAAVENECCPWATWTVAADAAHVVLDVHSAGDGIAALHGMFTRLRPGPASCPR